MEFIENLSDEKKAVLHLMFWEDRSIEEIAYLLGKRATRIEMVFKEALTDLRTSYKFYGGLVT